MLPDLRVGRRKLGLVRGRLLGLGLLPVKVVVGRVGPAPAPVFRRFQAGPPGGRLARDFNRLIQDQRKALNLDISDRIVVSYTAPPRIAEAITAHEAYLRNELLAERLEPSTQQNGAAKLSLNGEEIFVTITRV